MNIIEHLNYYINIFSPFEEHYKSMLDVCEKVWIPSFADIMQDRISQHSRKSNRSFNCYPQPFMVESGTGVLLEKVAILFALKEEGCVNLFWEKSR